MKENEKLAVICGAMIINILIGIVSFISAERGEIDTTILAMICLVIIIVKLISLERQKIKSMIEMKLKLDIFIHLAKMLCYLYLGQSIYLLVVAIFVKLELYQFFEMPFITCVILFLTSLLEKKNEEK